MCIHEYKDMRMHSFASTRANLVNSISLGTRTRKWVHLLPLTRLCIWGWLCIQYTNGPPPLIVQVHPRPDGACGEGGRHLGDVLPARIFTLETKIILHRRSIIKGDTSTYAQGTDRGGYTYMCICMHIYTYIHICIHVCIDQPYRFHVLCRYTHAQTELVAKVVDTSATFCPLVSELSLLLSKLDVSVIVIVYDLGFGLIRHTRTHTHTHTHTHINICIHTYKHIHIYIYIILPTCLGAVVAALEAGRESILVICDLGSRYPVHISGV